MQVELVSTQAGDTVSLVAYEALRNRERIAVERNSSLQEQVQRRMLTYADEC